MRRERAVLLIILAAVGLAAVTTLATLLRLYSTTDVARVFCYRAHGDVQEAAAVPRNLRV